MIAEAFAYVIAVTSLIGLAAASTERMLAELGRPRRLAWMAGYAVAVMFPAVSLLLAKAPPTNAVHAIAAVPLAGPSPMDWDLLLVRAWAATTALLLLAYLAAWIRLGVVAKRWPCMANDRALVVLAENVGPAVLGILRPRVVLPRWLAAAPESVRRTVIAHELEHIAARDQASILAAQLLTVLLPWNLPLWWFAKRLRLSIELDCDARVLRSGVDAGHYADVLLEVGQRRSSSPYFAASLVEPVTQLERRIRIMLTKPKSGAALRAAVAAAIALGLAACVSRVDPPAVVSDTEPSADANQEAAPSNVGPIFRVPLIGGMPKREPTESTEEQDAAVIYTQDGTPTVVKADRFTKTEDGMVLEGNVKIAFDRTTIMTSRAVAKVANDGTVALQLDDAIVTTNPGAPEGTL